MSKWVVLVMGVVLAVAGCGSEPAATPPPPPSSSPSVATTVVATTAVARDAGEQFLKLLGPAVVGSLSRSHIVDLGRAMAKDYCPKVKYGDKVIMADLMVSLQRAGFDGKQDVDWLVANGQQIALAMGLSFCDPRYS